MVGVTGFEPATSSFRTKRATKLRLHPAGVGANDETRTRDLLITNQLPSQHELHLDYTVYQNALTMLNFSVKMLLRFSVSPETP